eukprot:SM000114S24119  [mRNA]  locus=s114:59280:66958:- [translate_table: standard]
MAAALQGYRRGASPLQPDLFLMPGRLLPLLTHLAAAAAPQVDLTGQDAAVARELMEAAGEYLLPGLRRLRDGSCDGAGPLDMTRRTAFLVISVQLAGLMALAGLSADCAGALHTTDRRPALTDELMRPQATCSGQRAKPSGSHLACSAMLRLNGSGRAAAALAGKPHPRRCRSLSSRQLDSQFGYPSRVQEVGTSGKSQGWESCTSITGPQSRRQSTAQEAMSFSIEDVDSEAEKQAAVAEEILLSCTTFNILAPIYKRIDNQGLRESQLKDIWLARNEQILSMLLGKASSMICLQEFWLGSKELVSLYQEKLGQAGYSTYTLARTNNRGDGLITAIDTSKLSVVDYKELLFHDCGDRVAQLLRVKSKLAGADGGPLEMLLLNTHLLFPHNANSCLIRLRQAYKILEYVENYKLANNLPLMPIILCGDWNGSKRGQVYKFLRSQGFVSSFDLAHKYTDTERQKWVSHKNHRGNICGVDFIWLLNPVGQTKPLTADWKAAVFGMIKAKLREFGLNQRAAFEFFMEDGSDGDDRVTLKDFQTAMDKLGLTSSESVGLTRKEIVELMDSADTDGNGYIDYEEFKNLLSTPTMEEAYTRIKEATGIVEQPWLPTASNAFQQSPHGHADSPAPTSSLQAPAHAVESRMRDSILECDRQLAVRHKLEDCIAAGLVRDLSLENGMEDGHSHGFSFAVKEAHFYPPETELGKWPDNFTLSDHAPLTAVFQAVA